MRLAVLEVLVVLVALEVLVVLIQSILFSIRLNLDILLSFPLPIKV
jgi:hypothetical protein